MNTERYRSKNKRQQVYKSATAEYNNNGVRTLREIANDVGMPESSLRLCRDEFEPFLPAFGEGRRRRYGDASAETLKQIAQWKRAGWTATQVRDALVQRIRPEERWQRRNVEDRLDELAALLRTQAGEIAMLRVEVGALRAELKKSVRSESAFANRSLADVLAAATADI